MQVGYTLPPELQPKYEAAKGGETLSLTDEEWGAMRMAAINEAFTSGDGVIIMNRDIPEKD